MADGSMERHAFVVRIWREQGWSWRGWVQHTGSQEQLYVQSVEDLVTFLHDHTAGLLEYRKKDGQE